MQCPRGLNKSFGAIVSQKYSNLKVISFKLARKEYHSNELKSKLSPWKPLDTSNLLVPLSSKSERSRYLAIASI